MVMRPATTALPPGRHEYGAVLSGMRAGRYRFARLRAASGRLNILIGLSPAQHAAIAAQACSRRLGMALLGSRVSGPRSRQRSLHPALAASLPLSAGRRTPSPTWPGAEGLVIDKTVIKEFGPDDPRTSDLTIILIDPQQRPAPALAREALEMELAFRSLGAPFPIKVFPSLDGKSFASEREFQAHGASYLEGNLPPGESFKEAELRQAFSELYAPLNIRAPLFMRADAVNGAWTAALSTLSSSAALPMHPVVPLAGFVFGACGRYLARFKSWVAQVPAETPLTNAAALAADWLIGIALMACVLSPAAGWGLSLERIAGASALHSLAKGSWRIWLDKKFSRLDRARQARGVFYASGLNFIIGLVTAFVYSGRPWAAPLQLAVAAAGLVLAFRPSRDDL